MGFRIHLRSLAFVIWTILALPLMGAASDFDRLYQDGLDSKKAGNYEEAIMQLKKAVAFEPRNVEAHYQLGTVLGWAKHYDEGLEVLNRALALAPQNSDVRLGAARVPAWKGDFATARAEAERVLVEQPNHLEARVLRGRILSWQKDYDAAESEYQAILALAPEKSDAQIDSLVGLGDVMMWQEMFPEAREYYEKALAAAPDAPDIKEKIHQTKGRGPWRLDLGYSYSTFSRQQRSDWHEGYARLGYQIDKKTNIHLRFGESERFDLLDQTFEAGVDYRFTDAFSAYLSAEFTPDADFLADWKAATGGSFQLWKADRFLGTTTLLFDYRHSVYAAGAAESFSPGLQQYFGGRFWITAKWLHGINLSGQHTNGWLLRADWLVIDTVDIYVGMAVGKESLTASGPDLTRAVPTQTIFCGIAWEIKPGLGVRVDYSHEELENLYLRDSIHLGMFVRF